MLGPCDCRVGRKIRWGGGSRENREEAAAIVEVGEDEGWTRIGAWSWVTKSWNYFGDGDTGPAQYEAGVIWGKAATVKPGVSLSQDPRLAPGGLTPRDGGSQKRSIDRSIS